MSNQIDRLKKLLEHAKEGEKKQYGDDKEWKLQRDKAGNGYAILRFMPEPTGEDFCWAHYWSHGFQGPTGQWYIENSRTSLGKGNPDPVTEMNSRLYASGLESDKEIVSKGKNATKRKEHYVSNVRIVKDEKNPENEGKVFRFRYGKKIFQKILDAMEPPFKDKDPIEPFSFTVGANFKLRCRLVDGQVNYDLSEFDAPSSVGDKKTQDALQAQLHTLKHFTDPSNFKSYDELKERLHKVMGDTIGSGVPVIEGIVSKGPSQKVTQMPSRSAPEPRSVPVVHTPEASASFNDEDLDADLAAFRRQVGN